MPIKSPYDGRIGPSLTIPLFIQPTKHRAVTTSNSTAFQASVQCSETLQSSLQITPYRRTASLGRGILSLLLLGKYSNISQGSQTQQIHHNRWVLAGGTQPQDNPHQHSNASAVRVLLGFKFCPWVCCKSVYKLLSDLRARQRFRECIGPPASLLQGHILQQNKGSKGT